MLRGSNEPHEVSVNTTATELSDCGMDSWSERIGRTFVTCHPNVSRTTRALWVNDVSDIQMGLTCRALFLTRLMFRGENVIVNECERYNSPTVLKMLLLCRNINTDMLNVLSALDVEVPSDLCYSFLVDLLG